MTVGRNLTLFSSFFSLPLVFQEHLPYADDSNAVTPMSEENGAIIVPVSYANFGSRHSSYTSHTSRITYTSHADLFKPPMTKERQLRSRSARNYFNPSEQRYYPDVRIPFYNITTFRKTVSIYHQGHPPTKSLEIKAKKV